MRIVDKIQNKIKDKIKNEIRDEIISEIQNNVDNNLSTLTTETIKHSGSYTDLIKTYVLSVEKNSTLKRRLKMCFFWITMVILCGIVGVFCFISVKTINIIKLSNTTITTITGIISVMIPAISSLVVALLKIPQIIAQYLFDTKEDRFMNQIIKNIQEHDKAMYAMSHNINTLMKSNETEDIPEDTQLEDEMLEDID